MSVLRDYFGESSEPVTVSAKHTNWPHAPENLRPILDLWDELAGEVHSVQAKKQRRYGAQQWYDENQGQALDLLRRAKRYAEDNMLTVVSPGSLVFYAVKHKKQIVYTPCPECGRVASHAEDCTNG